MQVGKSDPKKVKVNTKCFSVLDVLFGGPGFFCSLEALRGGLRISILQFLVHKS
jgi:hypothetical protein